MIWHFQSHALDLTRTHVMAIVNVTPDSFSDGGLYYKPGEAMARARNCVSEGADILDLGAESTRPDATPISWELEWSRLEPVLTLITRELPNTPLSVDTYHPETAARALDLGVSILNCVKFEAVPAMIALAKVSGAGLILPCRSADDFATIRQLAGDDANLLARIVIDPLIGFDTTREQDVALLGSLRTLAALAPVCVGVSRKRLIKKLTGERLTGKNLGGSVGAAVWCAMCGASILRVHDVKETRQAIDVACLLARETASNPKEFSV